MCHKSMLVLMSVLRTEKLNKICIKIKQDNFLFNFNVSSMKLLIVNQCVSNSPSNLRGGRGALIPQEKVL